MEGGGIERRKGGVEGCRGRSGRESSYMDDDGQSMKVGRLGSALFVLGFRGEDCENFPITQKLESRPSFE